MVPVRSSSPPGVECSSMIPIKSIILVRQLALPLTQPCSAYLGAGTGSCVVFGADCPIRPERMLAGLED
jgi:hypothetical protein